MLLHFMYIFTLFNYSHTKILKWVRLRKYVAAVLWVLNYYIISQEIELGRDDMCLLCINYNHWNRKAHHSPAENVLYGVIHTERESEREEKRDTTLPDQSLEWKNKNKYKKYKNALHVCEHTVCSLVIIIIIIIFN